MWPERLAARQGQSYKQVYTQAMKTAISIPDEVFRQAERSAKRLGVSRSESFTRAMREYLGACRDSTVTALYDEAFAENDGELSAFRRETAREALLHVELLEE